MIPTEKLSTNLFPTCIWLTNSPKNYENLRSLPLRRFVNFDQESQSMYCALSSDDNKRIQTNIRFSNKIIKFETSNIRFSNKIYKFEISNIRKLKKYIIPISNSNIFEFELHFFC
jgi:hypothetical protein